MWRIYSMNGRREKGEGRGERGEGPSVTPSGTSPFSLLPGFQTVPLDQPVRQPTEQAERQEHHHDRAPEVDQVHVLAVEEKTREDRGHRPMKRRRWRR